MSVKSWFDQTEYIYVKNCSSKLLLSEIFQNASISFKSSFCIMSATIPIYESSPGQIHFIHNKPFWMDWLLVGYCSQILYLLLLLIISNILMCGAIHYRTPHSSLLWDEWELFTCQRFWISWFQPAVGISIIGNGRNSSPVGVSGVSCIFLQSEIFLSF